MEILKDLFAFLTDTDRHFSTKAAIFIAIFTGALLANNLFGFTYYYNISNKIEKASAINKLIGDSATSVNNKTSLIAMRDEVLSRETILEAFARRISSAYNGLKFNASGGKSNKLPSSPSTNHAASQHSPSRSGFWFVASASGIYIIGLLIMIPFLLINSVSTKDYFNFVLGSIAVTGAFYGMATFNYYAFGLIPLIANNWIWNYLLNFILQFGILVFIALLLSRSRSVNG